MVNVKDDNEPSTKEVFSEMVKSKFIRETTAKYAAKIVGVVRVLKDFTIRYSSSTAVMSALPYLVPTTGRWVIDSYNDCIDREKICNDRMDELNCANDISGAVRLYKQRENSDIESRAESAKTAIPDVLAGFTAFAGLIFQISAYKHLSSSAPNDYIAHGHPEVWLIPLATNVVSGIYEVGRSMYKDAKQKLVDKQNPSDLEVSVQDANQHPSNVSPPQTTHQIVVKRERDILRNSIDALARHDPNKPLGPGYC